VCKGDGDDDDDGLGMIAREGERNKVMKSFGCERGREINRNRL
jgi:hypothetical protein